MKKRTLLSLILITTSLLNGCSLFVVNDNATVPTEIQEAIATDLFDVFRIEVDAATTPVTIDPDNPAEQRLLDHLRRNGYEVHVAGDRNVTTLNIYYDPTEEYYLGSVNVGFVKRLTRQYRYDADGLKTIGATTIGG